MSNPYYSPEELDLEMASEECPHQDYSFDIICFWKNKEGLVFHASDSGCSCPSPFEDYCGENQTEVIQKLERVGSFEQAEQIIDAWNVYGDGKRTDVDALKSEVKSWLGK